MTRRDALLNRDRILEAARQVFAEEGVNASMSGIARRAGVGVSTLFRRFPEREDLVAAVFAQPLAQCAAVTSRAFADPDAWAGLRTFILEMGRMQALDRGLAAVVISWFTAAYTEIAIGEESCGELDRMITRAKSSGTLCADFSRDDIALLLRANSGVLVDENADWERFLTKALNGYHSC